MSDPDENDEEDTKEEGSTSNTDISCIINSEYMKVLGTSHWSWSRAAKDDKSEGVETVVREELEE